MAKLDEYWGQIQKSESFQDLDMAQKEKVRSSLWDKYVQKSPSYTGLPLTQRDQVRKHFDDLTKIEPESMGQDLMKRGKKIVEAVKPIAKKVGEAVSGAVDVSKIGSDLDAMGATAQEIPGMKAAAAGAADITERVASAIEPNFVKPSLTPFDVARAIGSGAVRTVGDFFSGMIPETTMGAAAYAVPADAVLKYAGLTFPTLAKDIRLPGWKPKTGLSSAATNVGDKFEKLITSENINQHVRENIDKMKGGNPNPLEVLANEERKLVAQNEVQGYEEWLQKVDQLSPQGGEPSGDLYPQMKVNVTQLRDMAKERLEKLQNEPVRVESLSRAEDELQGYYRRKVDQARVFLMPQGPEAAPQALLGAPEKSAGLLESGKQLSGDVSQGKIKPTVDPRTAASAPSVKAGDVVANMYKIYNPDQTNQANKIRAGVLLKAMGFKSGESLGSEQIGMLQKFIDIEHAGKPIPKPTIPDSLQKLREEAGFPNPSDPMDITQQSMFQIVSDFGKSLGEKGQIGGEIDPVRQAQQEAIVQELVKRARSLGYQTSQDVLLYAARNAPKEMQEALRKNLAPTLSAFDDHPYKEMEAAKKGNPVAKKSMMDAAQRGYLAQKADIVKGVYKKFKANQQVVLFKDMDEGLMKLKNDLFIHDNYRKFTKDELAAQRWYTEGKSPKLESLTALGVPEEQAKRWLDLAKNPTENMKSARKMTQIFEDEYHDVLSEFYDRVGYREDHVTRRWKRPEEYLDWEGRTLGNRPNFLKGAKLLSQAQGIDAGLEPVSFDIREDLRASNHSRVNVLSRIHAYQKLGASFGPDGMPAIIDESKDLITQAKNAKITPHSGDAPASWIRTNDVPLLRGLAINPYYKTAMKFMMSRPFTGTTPEVLNFLSASTKATKLYGFFHGYTLGEMTASGISYRDVFSFSKNRNPLFRGLRYAVKGMTADLEGTPLEWGTPAKGIKSIGKLYNSFMTGSGMLANRPLALDMAEHGFKFGSADEDMHGILKKTLNAMEKSLSKKIGEGAAKGLTALPRTALDIQEAALWRYVRPISSMLVYETNLKDAILKFNLEAAEGQKMPIDQIKQAIVNQTAKEMGGISYARLMINPRTQQVLQWAMLAPGWTIGRALMGASMFEKGPEGRQARKQMAKLFVGWFFSSNMINYAQTKKHLGKGRYMWENPEGYRNQAFLSKEKDGSTRYLQMSKALTEIYDDIDHPMRTAAYKMSAPLQAAVKVYNWATKSAYSPGTEPENPLMAAVHAYEPMITAGNSAYGGLPLKRGPSKNKVEAVLDEYYKGGMKDSALFEEAMQTGIEQGYDMSKLDRMVRANRTSKERRALLQ
jgi:hypothetical protein